MPIPPHRSRCQLIGVLLCSSVLLWPAMAAGAGAAAPPGHEEGGLRAPPSLEEQPVLLPPGGFKVDLEGRFRSVRWAQRSLAEPRHRQPAQTSQPRRLLNRRSHSRSASLSLVVGDDPGEGFLDPTVVAPVGGNAGATLGEQRVLAFQAAADQWGAVLASEIAIRISASMDSLFCDVSDAILAESGTAETYRDFLGAPRPSTWYPSALANALAVFDLSPAGVEIEAVFNETLDSSPGCLNGDGWWYGIDQAAPPGQPDFFATVLHELAHGLGFMTFVDIETGERLEGFDDAFMVNLYNDTLDLAWPDMTDAERIASATDTSHLVWTVRVSSVARHHW